MTSPQLASIDVKPEPIPHPDRDSAVRITLARGHSAFCLKTLKQRYEGQECYIHPEVLRKQPSYAVTSPTIVTAPSAGEFGPNVEPDSSIIFPPEKPDEKPEIIKPRK